MAVWQLLLNTAALRTAGAPTAPSGGASKHIDWYCGECDPRYLNSSYPTSHPHLLDGIMPCCGGGCHPDGGPCWGLSINCTTGQIDIARHNLSAYAPFLRAGKTVNVDLSGEAACCASETNCTILENKEALAAQVLEIALLYNLSGFTMDWEFGHSFNWDGYNQTMSHIAETLRPHGKGLGISINSGCEAGPNSSSDPSCDPAYRNTPWAAVLTDMGTYEIGDQQPTWARRGANSSCPPPEGAPPTVDPDVISYCGYEGPTLNMLHSPMATVYAQRWPQLSPAMWVGECFANGSTAHGWDRPKWRAHLAFLDTQNITRIGLWCHGSDNPGVGFPCTGLDGVCSWFIEELASWKAKPAGRALKGDDHAFVSEEQPVRRFPPGVFVDAAEFGAVSDGRTDTTKALQAAISNTVGFHPGNAGHSVNVTNKVLLLRPGAFVVSDTLTGRDLSGAFQCYMTLQGSGVSATSIVLADHAAGFADVARPKAVVFAASCKDASSYVPGDGECGFKNALADLTIDVGHGNAGAVAADFIGNNKASIARVRLVGHASSGVVGLSLARRYVGPMLVKSLTVEGFRVGVNVSNPQCSVTMADINLRGQTFAGLANSQNVVSVENLRSEQATAEVPAILLTTAHGACPDKGRDVAQGLTTIIAANMTANESTGAATSAVRIACGCFYGRDLKSDGYDVTVRSPDAGGGNPRAPKSERGEIVYPAQNMTGLYGPGRSLRLPVRDMPENDATLYEDVSGWVSVCDAKFGTSGANCGNGFSGDDTDPIERALNSGRRVVYFPSKSFRVTRTIVIRSTALAEIVGMEATLQTVGAFFAPRDGIEPALFRVEQSASVLTIRQLTQESHGWGCPAPLGCKARFLEHASPSTVVLRHLLHGGVVSSAPPGGAPLGDLFAEDICCGAINLSLPQRAWLRQLNIEERAVHLSVSGGAQAWVLGMKTEQAGGEQIAVDGEDSAVELLGAFFMPFSGMMNSVEPAAVSVTGGARASFGFAEGSYTPIGKGSYPVLVMEERDGEIRRYNASSAPKRGGGYGTVVPLFSAGRVGLKADDTVDDQRQPLALFVHPAGHDGASGAADAPLRTCAAAMARLKANPPPAGATVHFAAGLHTLNASTSCGNVSLHGNKGSAFTLTGDPAGGSVFDGTQLLDATLLAPVRNATVSALINPQAKGKVMVMPLATKPKTLEWDGIPMTESIWPNPSDGSGLGYVQRVFDKGAAWAPDGHKSGVPKPVGTRAKPVGARFSVAEQPTGHWHAEMHAGHGFGEGVSISGWFSADWFLESHIVADINQSATGTNISIVDSSWYGFLEAIEGGYEAGGSCGAPPCGPPGRFTVSGLLSNVDRPGEWWYDSGAGMLYVYPVAEAPTVGGWRAEDLASVRFGQWSSGGLLTLTNSSYVTVRDLTVSGTGAGTMVLLEGGDHNTVGGCTFKNSAATAVGYVGGHFNKIVGNDIYDVANHLSSLSGNPEDNLHNLRPSNNLIANNQMTNVYLAPAVWNVVISGTGTRFSRNLLHDTPREAFDPGGWGNPMQMIDHNEFMNTGYAVGDGGVMYVDASQVQGYGMHVRENFIHHSLDIPELKGRNGLLFDDHFGGLSNCSGNVLYKAAGTGILGNGGSNHNITHNLIVNVGAAIGNIAESAATQYIHNLPKLDNGTACCRGIKTDYIYNTEHQLGVSSFEEIFGTPFAKRWPSFARQLSVNSTSRGWASPAGWNISNNVVLNCTKKVCLNAAYWLYPNITNKTPNSAMCDDELENWTRVSKEPFMQGLDSVVDADWSQFPEAAGAGLEFINPKLGFDTREMGLRCDEFRRSIPSPALYRPWVKAAFAGVSSHPADEKYTPAGAAARAKLRSGKALVLNFTRPCPALVKADCEEIWLAWGECQVDGQQVWRYTVEKEPVLGGRACEHEDGFATSFPC